MGKLVVIVGPSGIGKTALAHALVKKGKAILGERTVHGKNEQEEREIS